MVTERTVADAVLDQLASWGVRRIYGYAGDAILFFLDAVNKHPEITYIQTRHEAAAAFMASAEAKLTGRIGVCTATCGPGTANLINGLADASADKAPVLAITGQVPTKYIGTDYKQYIEEQTLLQPLIKYGALLAAPEPAMDIVYTALQVATGQGGVAHIAVPKDIFTKPCQDRVRPQNVLFPACKEPRDQGIQKALAVLEKAARPMFLVGRGARGKGRLVEELAQKVGAAVTYSLPAKGVIAGDFPLLVGGLGLAGSHGVSQLLEQADCLLMIGSTWWPEKFVPRQIPIIQVDGSLENMGIQCPIAVGIEGCIAKTLDLLLEKSSSAPNNRWRETIKKSRQNWLEELHKEREYNENPISPQRLVYSVEKNLAPEAVVALDVGEHVLWFAKIFCGKRQFPLLSGSWRSMGFGLPAALAAKLADQERQVVALVGDGGITMVMGELVTAAELGLNVKVIVFNNKSLSMERNRMIVTGISQTGTNLDNPDFKKVAEACGWEAYQVEDVSVLDDTVAQAFASNRPALLDVTVSTPIPAHTAL
ncbi:MAG: thiamine pyrophosphate-binding protein [Peptococcaceae bacterium]